MADATLSPALRLDLDAMRLVVAIAETGGVTAAAARLARTPAALSMQLRKLEEALARRLFHRGRAGMRPTPEGERLLPHARRMIAAERAAREAFEIGDLQGAVRVGMIDDLGGVRFSQVLAAFAECHPQVTVDVVLATTVELAAMLDRGALDLAAMAPSAADWRPADAALHDEPLVWAARDAALWSRRPLPLALSTDGCAWRRVALDALEGEGIAYRVAYRSDASAPLIAAAEAGLAVAVLPLSRVTPALKVLGAEDGAPAIGRARAALRLGAEPSAATAALAARLREGFGAAL